MLLRSGQKGFGVQCDETCHRSVPVLVGTTVKGMGKDFGGTWCTDRCPGGSSGEAHLLHGGLPVAAST